VSEEEIRLFKLFRQSEAEEAEARRQAKKLAKSSDLDAKASAAAKLEEAGKSLMDGRNAWDAERNRNEPQKVKAFRSTLLKCTCVGQLFDPWYMYTNSTAPGMPNTQQNANEKLHAHHLHITVRDRKIVNL